jgi:hypothetical protein
MRKKQQRIEGISIVTCGGSLCTCSMGVPMTAYDEGTDAPPPLMHHERVEFRRGNDATPISTVMDLVEELARHSCSLVEEAARDPEGFARILRFLLFPESAVRVVGHESIEQDHLEAHFEMRVADHVPRVVDRELQFAVRHAPPPLGPDGEPLRPAPGSFGLRPIDPASWRVLLVTVDLVTGESTRRDIPKRTGKPPTSSSD